MPRTKKSCADSLALDQPLMLQYRQFLGWPCCAATSGGHSMSNPGHRAHPRQIARHDRANSMRHGNRRNHLFPSRDSSRSERKVPGSTGAPCYFLYWALSLPNFWLGPLLMIVFSIQLGWTPVSGRGGLDHLSSPSAHARDGDGSDTDPHPPRQLAPSQQRRLRAQRSGQRTERKTGLAQAYCYAMPCFRLSRS